MKASDYSIEQGAIVLRSPDASDVERARRGFVLALRQRPRITVRGLFPAGSVKDHPLDELRLLDPPPVPVLLVGRLYLTIEWLPRHPVGRRMIEPLKGRNVEVRLRLPEASEEARPT